MESFEVEIKTNNLQAHLNVLKGNVAEASEELAEVTGRLNNAHLELEALEDEVQTKRDELLGLRRDLENVQDVIVEEKERYEKEKELHQEEEDGYEGQISMLVEVLAAYYNDKSLIEKEIDELLNKRAEQASRYLEDANRLKGALEGAESEYDDQRKKVIELIGLVRQLDEGVKSFKKELDEKKKKLEEREEKIVERETELQHIALDYSRRSKALKNREADGEVIARRLKAAYKMIYPDRELRI